ncbi:hypothetical protein QUF63_08135 [Anaerolineales bacterium HSG25]|nr:hypothetical protein [Anaerolineales bacterium HSG25]
MTIRLSIWSGPRNVSTALMYAFAQRNDTRVIDEPFYGHYLTVSDAKTFHPGADEVMADMDCDGPRVVHDVLLTPTDKPVLFFKNMTHHLVELDWGFLNQLTNVILTRDPVDMLPSLAKKFSPTLRDTGYDTQIQLLDYLEQHGQAPVIIDSCELLTNPSHVLGQLCQRIDIPFDKNMLQWQTGARPEDGIWAKHWYHSVHKSTSFAPYRPKTAPFPEALRPLLTECQPYYERLFAQALKAKEATLTTQRDGIYLAPSATLTELSQEPLLDEYATGLIPQALAQRNPHDDGQTTLQSYLFQAEAGSPLFTTLISLDAELKTVVAGKVRILPLPTFLSYRAKLAADGVIINNLRLPPLNYGGHYLLKVDETQLCFAVRMDIQSEKRLAGHVRVVVSSAERPATRLENTERRLTWQPLNQTLIEEAIEFGNADLSLPLTAQEKQRLQALLVELIP